MTDRSHEPCPICERPRFEHDPRCNYEGTLLAAAERYNDAWRGLGREIIAALPRPLRDWLIPTSSHDLEREPRNRP